MSDDVFELAKRCFRYQIESQTKYAEERMTNLDAEIKKSNERLNKLFNLLLDGKIDDELYSKKSSEIESTLDDLLISRSAVSRSGIELFKYSENLFELFKMSSRIYSRLENSKKRELLNLLCLNFSYDGENLKITIKKTFQPLVEIANLEKLERRGFEPLTPTLPVSCATSCANAPE